jgi:hypothetical protein
MEARSQLRHRPTLGLPFSAASFGSLFRQPFSAAVFGSRFHKHTAIKK